MKDPPTPPHSNVPYEKPAKIKHLGTHPTAYRQMTAVSRCFYRPTGKAPRPTTRGFSCPKIPCRKRHYHVHNREKIPRLLCRYRVSMPQAALPCAQRSSSISLRFVPLRFNAASGITMCTTLRPSRRSSRNVVSMPQAALPCAQRSGVTMHTRESSCFNAASGITMCTTTEKTTRVTRASIGFNAASGITMCTTRYSPSK